MQAAGTEAANRGMVMPDCILNNNNLKSNSFVPERNIKKITVKDNPFAKLFENKKNDKVSILSKDISKISEDDPMDIEINTCIVNEDNTDAVQDQNLYSNLDDTLVLPYMDNFNKTKRIEENLIKIIEEADAKTNAGKAPVNEEIPDIRKDWQGYKCDPDTFKRNENIWKID